ncbi:hypothetical protein EX30DRAFT_343782 [Ascodesmis nigricans]|uniref:Uncharacterized protein n=1 Tax=Ascodesmis nigricans TaxID=341454 RepID=A0A4S2ML02_9PEZI|nr:hypothetical protein EX30DRAFT_343782 [Ascodesmis nigricans]
MDPKQSSFTSWLRKQKAQLTRSKPDAKSQPTGAHQTKNTEGTGGRRRKGERDNLGDAEEQSATEGDKERIKEMSEAERNYWNRVTGG